MTLNNPVCPSVSNASINMKGLPMRIILSLVMSAVLALSGCDGDGDKTRLEEIEMVSTLSIPGNLTMDVWGYVDDDGREYAIVGDFSDLVSGSLSIVDVTEPKNPVLVANTDLAIGFDMKTWNQYLYVANGSFSSTPNDSTNKVFDLSDPTNPVLVGTFPGAHNIFVDERGYLCAEGGPGGLKVYDLNPDPANPTLIWDDPLTSSGHDAAVIRGRLYDFHGFAGTFIYDFADPASPVLIGSFSPPGFFHHSGWVTEDDGFLYLCDEGAVFPLPNITVWDIRDLDNPTQVAEITHPTERSHNLYIVGRYAYVSYYGAGFRVFDVADPQSPTLVDEFQTNLNAGAGIGNGFLGAFGVYPFSQSGLIFVSDMNNGLLLFSFEGLP